MTDPTPLHMPGGASGAGQSSFHTLVLVDQDFDLRHAVECPGVTDLCRLWMPCPDSRCLHDDCVQTPSDLCYFLVADEFVPDSLPDAVDRLVDREQLEPGRYPIAFTFGDCGVDELTLLVGDGKPGAESRSDRAG